MRWNLLKQVNEVNPGVQASGTADFPSKDASWQLLVIEMMAQLGGLVIGARTNFSEDVVFAKIEKANYFGNPSEDKLFHIQCTADHLGEEGGWLQGVVSQENVRICEAKFLLLKIDRIHPDQAGSLTFHQQFMEHYAIRSKVVS